MPYPKYIQAPQVPAKRKETVTGLDKNAKAFNLNIKGNALPGTLRAKNHVEKQAAVPILERAHGCSCACL